ncbi:hypothetical protein SLEP1_g6764 [Rubroshorea leprosula]|uniref:Uncharacterized protein n=1 Tax=Rubroshorea leprosula TaxID=152421 RepID=A0AAV5I4C7_9ROSI|nr:hypothetical protein SLEP1_g6764 [Rubroshorea leprosula]
MNTSDEPLLLGFLKSPMSLLQSFKEILKPCKTLSSSSSPSLSSQSSTQSLFSQQESDPTVFSRKPPKSSISRQLQRLEDDYLALTQESEVTDLQNLETQHGHVEKKGDDEEEEEKE